MEWEQQAQVPWQDEGDSQDTLLGRKNTHTD